MPFRGGGSSNSGENRNRNYSFGDLAMYTGRNLSLKVGFDGEYRANESLQRQNFQRNFHVSRVSTILLPASPSSTRSTRETRSLTSASSNPRCSFKVISGSRTGWLLGSVSDTRPRQTSVIATTSTPGWVLRTRWADQRVIRGGSGIFHQRLNTGVVGNLIRFDGKHQQSLTIRNPSFPDPFASEDGEATVSVPSNVNSRAEDLTAPYTWNSEVSVETTLGEGFVLTGAYKFIRGVHMFRGRNLNAPFDSSVSFIRSCPARTADETDEERSARCVRPQPERGNINQLESTGTSRSHNLRIGFRQRFSFVNINGSYNLDSNYSDATGAFGRPADNYDLASEWARVSGNASAQRIGELQASLEHQREHAIQLEHRPAL